VSVYQDLEALKSTLSGLEGKFSMIAILPRLQDRLSELHQSATNACSDVWDRSILASGDQDSVTLRINQIHPGNSNIGVELMVDFDEIFSSIESFGVLKQKIPELTTLLLGKFVTPLLTQNYSLSTTDDTMALKQELTPRQLDTLFTSLSCFITYLSSNLHPRTLPLLKQDLLPSLMSSLQENVLSPSLSSTKLSELQLIDDLIKEVVKLDRHLYNLKWATSTPLKVWASNAPQIWFEGRQAVLLDDTRKLISENLTAPDLIITQGANITVDPFDNQHEPNTEPEKAISMVHQKTEESVTLSVAPAVAVDEDEDDSNGWKFDDEEESSEIDNSIDNDTSEWKWEDEEEVDSNNVHNFDTNNNSHPNFSNQDTSDAFPYTISVIPDKLINLIQKFLNEATELYPPFLPPIFDILLIRGYRSKSTSVVSNTARKYPSSISYVLSLWRAIIRYHNTSMTRCQRIRISNDAAYLSHRLTSFTEHPEISQVIPYLLKFGDSSLQQEQVTISIFDPFTDAW